MKNQSCLSLALGGLFAFAAAGCGTGSARPQPLPETKAASAPAPTPPAPPEDPRRTEGAATAQIAQLSEHVTRLANEISELQNVIARLVATARQQDDELQLLQRRVSEIREARPDPSSAVPKGFAPSQTSSAPGAGSMPKLNRAEDLFATGKSQYAAGDANSAMLVLYELIASHPTHALREEAHFLIGEILYAQKDFPASLAEFEALLQARPRGTRVPDTLLKIGLCQRALGQDDRARRAWERLTKEHPNTAAAREARQLMGRGGRR